MSYYNKLGQKTTEELATYWVAEEHARKFKQLIREHKKALLNGDPVEWSINRLRYDEPRACGWVQH